MSTPGRVNFQQNVAVRRENLLQGLTSRFFGVLWRIQKRIWTENTQHDVRCTKKKKLEPNLHRTKYLHDRGNRTTPVWWSWKFKSYNLLQHLRTWIDIHRYPITYSCPISTGPSSVLLQGWGNYHLHVLHARRFRLWLKGWLDLVSIHILGDQITGSSANSFSKSWCFFFCAPVPWNYFSVENCWF